MKKCPYCAEEIQDEAIICRFCNCELPKSDEQSDKLRKAYTALEKSFIGSIICWFLGFVGAIYGSLLLNENEVGMVVFLFSLILIVISRIFVYVNIIRVAKLKKKYVFWFGFLAIFYTLPVAIYIFITKNHEEQFSQIPANFKLFVTLGIVLLIGLCIVLSNPELINNSQSRIVESFKASLTPTKRPTKSQTPTNPYTAIRKTYFAESTKTARAASSISNQGMGCLEWSAISLNDVGTKKCVYGNVIDQRRDGTALYMVFSPDYDAFYFISYGDWYYPGLEGDCAAAYGEIRQLGQAPVMVIDNDMLRQCE